MVVLIITMVINALDSEPIVINVSAVPNPAAAPSAKISGLGDKPCDNSGPLAQKAPAKARTTPIACPVVKTSPATSATVSGMTPLSALIGETTPMRPVDKPAYKQTSPMYPVIPAIAPGTK